MRILNSATDEGIIGRKDLSLKSQDYLSPQKIRDSRRRKEVRESTAIQIQEKIKRDKRKETTGTLVKRGSLGFLLLFLLITGVLTSEKISPETAKIFQNYFATQTDWRVINQPVEGNVPQKMWSCDGVYTSNPKNPSLCSLVD